MVQVQSMRAQRFIWLSSNKICRVVLKLWTFCQKPCFLKKNVYILEEFFFIIKNAKKQK